jgi:NAD-dependent SIR2 family protein deacetylase
VQAVQVDALARILEDRTACVLTGAGISTESGIPDYRGPETRDRPRRPIQHAEFVRSALVRQRYWARSTVGWPRFRAFEPNAAHHALRRLELAGRARGLVTQNVDRLHHKAGHEAIELHGALASVVCLGCGAPEDRDALQARLVADNPAFPADDVRLAPDGDADLPPGAAESFIAPTCLACGGVLKPDVVFFGGSVPRERVDAAMHQIDEAGALLVVGSSLTVWSGFRFARRAAERGIPIAIVNLGETRADPFATLKVDARAGDVLPRLAEVMT